MAMGMKHCTVCGKELPANYESNQCTLCAIGLTPADPLAADFRDFEASDAGPIGRDGRELSGIHCPECTAEFSLADIKRLRCDICGAEFTADRMASIIHFAETQQQDSAKPLAGVPGSEHKNWPDDAPLW
jgi:hypothetical protein